MHRRSDVYAQSGLIKRNAQEYAHGLSFVIGRTDPSYAGPKGFSPAVFTVSNNDEFFERFRQCEYYLELAKKGDPYGRLAFAVCMGWWGTKARPLTLGEFDDSWETDVLKMVGIVGCVRAQVFDTDGYKVLPFK